LVVTGLVELVAQRLDLLVGDGAVLGLCDGDEVVEVVALDLAGDGGGDVGGQAGGAAASLGGFGDVAWQ
jgi:hypothetical protein